MLSTDDLLPLLHETADAISAALVDLDDWGLAGTRAGQYRSDLAADRVAVEILTGAGLGVLSEESGVHHGDRPLYAVIDPVDGSTNASRRIPWYATSICVLDEEGPLAACRAFPRATSDGASFEHSERRRSISVALPTARSMPISIAVAARTALGIT
jgi:fructose-1,6-bisphosphatase/inositol monophosphatase family enzyme